MFTIEEINANLVAWKMASQALANSKEYEIDGRKLKRADAEEVLSMIKFWANEKAKKERGGGIKTQRALIRDL